MKDENMSPLLYYTKKQSEKISKLITKENLVIDFAMRYGNPSINSKIYKLKEQGCENLVILPLYPQYAAATTATVCDEVYRSLMKMRWQPSLQIIPHYESEPKYIDALVANNDIRTGFYTDAESAPPAATWIGCDRLVDPELLLEIECIAALD